MARAVRCSMLLLLAVVASSSSIYAQSVDQLHAAGPGSSIRLRGVASMAAVGQTRSLLQWWPGSQAQAQAQAQSQTIGGLSQAQAQAQAQAGAAGFGVGAGAQAQAQSQSLGFGGASQAQSQAQAQVLSQGGGWDGGRPYGGYNPPYNSWGGGRGYRRWAGRRLQSGRGVLAADKLQATTAADKQQSSDQYGRRPTQPYSGGYGPYGQGSSYSGSNTGSGSGSRSGSGSGAWANAANNSSFFGGRRRT